MIAIDLSTLNPAELRRLSTAARARGDGLLADRVDWEIAARSDHGLGHHPPAFAPPSIAPGAGPGGFEGDEMDAGPTAFRPHNQEAPRGARDGWRSVGLVILGAAVGSAATAGGFWAVDGFGRREPAPRVDVVRSAPPPAEILASREVAVPAPIPVAQTAEVRPPRTPRAVRRTAKARPARVEDPGSIARLYERGMRKLDAERARENEPIY